MSWEHYFDRARRSTGITIPKDHVGPIPYGFESAPRTIPGLFSVYRQERGLETIRIVELPGAYCITVNTPIQSPMPLGEPVLTPTPQGQLVPTTNPGPLISPETKRKLLVGGLFLVGAALLGGSESTTQPIQQRVHRVFISHSWKYQGHFEEIKAILDDEPGFNWYDHSVTAEQPIDAQLPNHLRSKLRDQIQSTHVVLIIGGMYTAHSEWMEEEIEIATEMGKPIIGVIPPGNQRAPRIVQDHATEIVDFEPYAILDAIRTHTS